MLSSLNIIVIKTLIGALKNHFISIILFACQLVKIVLRPKRYFKNLFCKEINCTFILQYKYIYYILKSVMIQDNTPSRLAVMQHTWEVFSFYTSPKLFLMRTFRKKLYLYTQQIETLKNGDTY